MEKSYKVVFSILHYVTSEKTIKCIDTITENLAYDNYLIYVVDNCSPNGSGKELQEKYKLTYLFISHDLSVVEHISDTVGVMYLGNLVEYGDKADIFRNPLHPYTKALFSAIPVPDPQIEKNKKLIVYDPSVHDYSTEQPELTDLGNGHMVFGSPTEIEHYRELRFG